MYKILVMFMVFTVSSVSAMEKSGGHGHGSHNDESHQHSADESVNGSDTAFPEKMFSEFTSDLANVQIVIVDVNGMVCDFCARGIEKTFQKDMGFRKIDVDLANGKVLLAYAATKKIVKEDIEQKILSNGQAVTDIQILTAQ